MYTITMRETYQGAPRDRKFKVEHQLGHLLAVDNNTIVLASCESGTFKPNASCKPEVDANILSSNEDWSLWSISTQSS